MRKDIILGLLLVLITSCASRKVDVVKNNSKTTVDSSVVVKTDSASTINNYIVFTELSEEFEYHPIDTSKCMDIDGKKYKNVVIKFKKANKKIDNKTKATTKKSSVKKLNVKREDKKDNLDRHVRKESNYWMYLWFLLPVLIIWLLEKYGNKLFPFIKYFK